MTRIRQKNILWADQIGETKKETKYDAGGGIKIIQHKDCNPRIFNCSPRDRFMF